MASQQSKASRFRDQRRAVDLSAYADLVVVYLGMQMLAPRGLRTLLRTGQEIQRSVEAKPAGLLLHEKLIWSLWPLHLGMRQYWQNLEALEQWTREGYHKGWWQSFVLDQGGTTFWHELYTMRGGIEGLYIAGNEIGMSSFAPVVPARGTMYSSRQRVGHASAAPDPIIREEEYETFATPPAAT